MFPFYKAFFLAPFSKPLYRDVAQRWKGIGLAYIFCVQVICTVLIVLLLRVSYSQFINDSETLEIIADLPSISVVDGVASADLEEPYFIDDPNTGYIFFTIDTSGQYTLEDIIALNDDTGDDFKTTILLAEAGVYSRNDSGRISVISFSELEDLGLDTFDINPTTIEQLLRWIESYMVAILFPLFLVFLFILRLVQAIFYAVIGFVVSKLVSVELTFEALIRMAFVGMTPVLLFEIVMQFIGLGFLPGWGFLGTAIVIGYLIFGILANQTQLENP